MNVNWMASDGVGETGPYWARGMCPIYDVGASPSGEAINVETGNVK